MAQRKIVQIIPADGWKARHEPEVDDVEPYEVPLVCWALVETSDGMRIVKGMEATEQGVVEELWDPQESDFSHYVPPQE